MSSSRTSWCSLDRVLRIPVPRRGAGETGGGRVRTVTDAPGTERGVVGWETLGRAAGGRTKVAKAAFGRGTGWGRPWSNSFLPRQAFVPVEEI